MKTVAELREEAAKLDRAAKVKGAEVERWTNGELAKFAAANGGRVPTKGDELFDRIDAALIERDTIRQNADNARAAADQLMRVQDAGAYLHEDVEAAQATEAARRFAASIGRRIVAAEPFKKMQAILARGSGDSPDAIMGDLSAVGAGARYSLGPLMSRDEWQALVSGGGMRPRATTVTGGGATSGGPFVVNDFQPGFEAYARKKPVMMGLVAVGTTDSDTVEFVRQTAVSTAAAETAEDTASTEATIAFETVTADVKDIPQHVPVTRRALSDAGQLQSIIENDLLNGVVDRVDTQIASGNGSGQNLTGIYNTSGILTFALGGLSRPDAIHHMITTLAIQAGVLAEPDAFGIYPSDWEELRLTKDSNGGYLMGPPNIPGPKSAFGLPAVSSTVFTNGTPLGGIFDGYQVWIREAPTVFVGLNSDDFTKRRVTVLAETRVAGAAKRPTKFVTVTGY